LSVGGRRSCGMFLLTLASRCCRPMVAALATIAGTARIVANFMMDGSCVRRGVVEIERGAWICTDKTKDRKESDTYSQRVVLLEASLRTKQSATGCEVFYSLKLDSEAARRMTDLVDRTDCDHGDVDVG
jgi:hypothetical protein